MTDSVTNNYSLTQPLVGGDTNTWGGVLNNGTIAAADAALGNTLAVTMTSSNVDLTTSQFQNKVFVVSGTLTGNYSLVIPLSPNSASVACGGEFIVVNNTSGAYILTVSSAAGGSSVTVPQGFTANLYSDGTNIGYCSNGLSGFALASNGNPNGQLAGTAGSVNTNASLAFDYVNSNFYICTTTGTALTAVWSQPTIVTPRGFGEAINLSLQASVLSNILTVEVLAANTATTPTSANPVIIAFRDATLSSGTYQGNPISISVTSALSISVPVGATLGTQSGKPFRFWIVVFNNGGTPVLGLINCSNATTIFPLNEATLRSPGTISSGSTSAGTFYASSALTNCAFRILGYLDYTTSLVTAGTYNNPPNLVQLFGPGIKKPGDIIQTVFSNAASISPTNVINLVKVSAFGSWEPELTGNYNFYLERNATEIAAVYTYSGSNEAYVSVSIPGFIDAPATTSPTSYSFIISPSTGVLISAYITAEEIMG